MIKFNRPLDSVGAIVSFDLAHYHTGVSVLETATYKIVKTLKIDVPKNSENPNLNLYWQIKGVLRELVEDYGDIMVLKEALPLQSGQFTTIKTLYSLCAAHAILDLVVALQEGAEAYDDTGVYSVSVKSFYRSEAIPKPEKSDIRAAVVKYYGLDDTILTDDISDSIGVVHTLIHRKWNQDIIDEIKRIKKEIKGLKAPKAIQAREQRIQELNNLKL